MLGDQIGEERGKVIGTRVLSSEGSSPKVEVSFHAFGQLLGAETSDIGTYCAILRPDGSLYGEGQGITTTKDGETATWKGQGVGKPTGQGSAASWRGAIYYQTSSQELAHLNEIAALFEYEVDEKGNTQAKLWEWK
ncbi:MAG: hypothetical protein ACE5MK_09140 [Acidobacteriota bacterium]